MSDGNDPSSSDGDGSSGHDSSDDEDSSEIMRACERGDLERLRRALDDGAPVDGYADSPGSPLYRVCEVANLSFISTREDKLAMVMLLLEAGARVDLKLASEPVFPFRPGVDAEGMAEAQGHSEIAQLIREHRSGKKKPVPSLIPGIQQQQPVQMNIDSMLAQPNNMAPGPDEKGKKKK